jgi:hypothetical protein
MRRTLTKTSKKPRRWYYLPVIAAAIICISCEGPMPGRFTRLGQTYLPKAKEANIEVFEESKPIRPFTEVARLDVHLEQGFFATPTTKMVMPELIKQARLAGADAIIDIRERRAKINETQTLHVTATGIKYTDAP